MSKKRLDLEKLHDGKLHEFTAVIGRQSADGRYNKTYLLLNVEDINGKEICEHVWVMTRNSKQRKALADKMAKRQRARIVGKVYEYEYENSGEKNFSFRVEKVLD